MRVKRMFLVFCIILIAAFSAAPVYAQRGEQDTGEFIDRIAKTLSDAGQPLSDEQIEKMENLEGGRNFRNEIMNILTGEQKTALRNSFRNNSRRDRGGAPNRGNFVELIGRTLEEANLPLSDEQKKQLEGLEFGPGMREKMEEVLTEEQNQALRDARQRSAGERRSPSQFIGGTLEEAGDPLTDEQKQKLDALEFGPDMRGQINEILTDSQKKILEERREQRGTNR